MNKKIPVPSRTEKHTIRAFDANPRGNITMPTLCSYLQEMAIAHAYDLGLGFHDLVKENLTWILLRLGVSVNSYPHWKDQITLKTWPSEYNKLYAWREFSVSGADDQTLAVGTSCWLVIDIESRRPVRLPLHIVEKLPPPAHKALELPKSRPDELSKIDGEKCFNVRYADIDMNQHVNNVSYITWALESMPVDILNESEVSHIDIEFRSECHYGEVIISRYQEVSEKNSSKTKSYRHCLVRQADGEELARVKTTWRKI